MRLLTSAVGLFVVFWTSSGTAAPLAPCERFSDLADIGSIEYFLEAPDPVTKEFRFSLFLPECDVARSLDFSGDVNVLTKTGSFTATSTGFGGFEPFGETVDARLFGNLAMIEELGGGEIRLLDIPLFWRLSFTSAEDSGIFPRGFTITHTCFVGSRCREGELGPIYLPGFDEEDELVSLLFDNGPVTVAPIPIAPALPLSAAAFALLGLAARRRPDRP